MNYSKTDVRKYVSVKCQASELNGYETQGAMRHEDRKSKQSDATPAREVESSEDQHRNAMRHEAYRHETDTKYRIQQKRDSRRHTT
jgi:hypothetical protein